MDSPKIHRSTIRVFQKETVTQIPGTRPILKKKSWQYAPNNGTCIINKSFVAVYMHLCEVSESLQVA